MLLRSSSTPILNSWIPTCTSSASSTTTPDLHPKSLHLLTTNTTPKPSSASCCCTCTSNSNTAARTSMVRAVSDSNLRLTGVYAGLGLKEREVVVEEEEVGGGGLYGGGGAWSGGYGGGYGGGGGGGTDGYYKRMIEANPGNSLLLSNYATFLKEVRGDYVKAEEYCGRAILANPGDPKVLALYADLIWQTHRDSSRAETYFDQAVKAAPDDCYVLGSYAHFLWDAEDEEEDDINASINPGPPMFYQGVSPSPPPLAAAS